MVSKHEFENQWVVVMIIHEIMINEMLNKVIEVNNFLRIGLLGFPFLG